MTSAVTLCAAAGCMGWLHGHRFLLVTAPAAQHHKQEDAAQLQPHGSHFRGMKREELVEPIPGRPCLTGLYEIENSAR